MSKPKCRDCGDTGWIIISYNLTQHQAISGATPQLQAELALATCGCGCTVRHFVCGQAVDPSFGVSGGVRNGDPVLEEIRTLSALWREGAEADTLEQIHFLASKRGLGKKPAFTGPVSEVKDEQ